MLHISHVFSSHWPEHCHMATNSCKGEREIQTLVKVSQAQMKIRGSIIMDGGKMNKVGGQGASDLCSV